jgi:hypothetical protein
MDGFQKYAGLICFIHFLLVLNYLGRTTEREEDQAQLRELQDEKKIFFFLLLPVYFKAMGFL